MKRINIKKAISFFMAVCLLAGNSYTGGTTGVSVTPVVQEISTETQEATENVTTGSIGDVFGEAVTAVKGFFSNFGKVRVASAEEAESQQPV